MLMVPHTDWEVYKMDILVLKTIKDVMLISSLVGHVW